MFAGSEVTAKKSRGVGRALAPVEQPGKQSLPEVSFGPDVGCYFSPGEQEVMDG
jgi:hypothetical protein